MYEGIVLILGEKVHSCSSLSCITYSSLHKAAHHVLSQLDSHHVQSQLDSEHVLSQLDSDHVLSQLDSDHVLSQLDSPPMYNHS